MIRGQEIMLDSDLAELYQVETFNLNKAVKRNLDRFPSDFMFQLTREESANLRFQIGISSYGGRRYLPYAFTEHGVAMLSSVLNSKRAVQMNIMIIRAFVQLRRTLAEHQELSKRLKKVEGKQNLHSLILDVMAEDFKKLKNPLKTNAIGFEWKPQK